MLRRAGIEGTRITVALILEDLAAGLVPEEIVRKRPSLTRRVVQAAILYAAELARERLVSMSG